MSHLPIPKVLLLENLIDPKVKSTKTIFPFASGIIVDFHMQFKDMCQFKVQMHIIYASVNIQKEEIVNNTLSIIL